MKLLRMFLAAIVVSLFAGASAIAQTYPVTNPTYIPNTRMTAFTVVSGVPNAAQTLNGVGTIGLQLSGTCTSLDGKLEGTVNGSNWVTMNLYPSDATSSTSAVSGVSATGLWFANSGGVNKVRFNNTAVSGTACAGSMAGSPNAFSLPR